MGLDDLGLCVERHATSKLPDGDLNHIGTLGFRGEALPSIASVSRLEIRSRARGSEEAWVLRVEEGVKDAPRPAAHPGGTWIEARDLFAATPARLKFLKTDRAEAQACAEGVRRLALANPQARFSFASDIGAAFDYPACPEGVEGERERMRQALGEEFVDNALRLDYQREGVTLYGWVGLPTYNKPNALNQFVFVNGRGVRDKLISGACRGAYLDYLPRDRHGALALFVECDPADVDVNVHPAKAEVRFRESSLVRGLIVSGIRQALEAARHKAASTGGAGMRPIGGRQRRARPSGTGAARRPRRRRGSSTKSRRSAVSRASRRACARKRGHWTKSTRAPRSARRGRKCTEPTSSPKPGTVW